MVKALVVYHSQQHGNTEKMANSVADGLKSEGCEVTLHNANEKRNPIDSLPEYDVVAVGTPDYYSYIAGSLKTLMDDFYFLKRRIEYTKRPVGLFYTHGGGGRVRDSLAIFGGLGDQVGEAVESNGAPDKKVLDSCYNLGVNLAKAKI